jgi:hypothetical protein
MSSCYSVNEPSIVVHAVVINMMVYITHYSAFSATTKVTQLLSMSARTPGFLLEANPFLSAPTMDQHHLPLFLSAPDISYPARPDVSKAQARFSPAPSPSGVSSSLILSLHNHPHYYSVT